MQRQSEYDQDNTLPQPELNPLVNPLLGQHMGRWAEVYFTAAPEDREEAVLALLKELESDAAPKPADSIRRLNFTPPDVAEDSGAKLPEFPPEESARTSPKLGRFAILPKSVTCESCGQAVPETQKFCGMCGASMRGESAAKLEWTKVSDSIEVSTPMLEDKFNPNAVSPEWVSRDEINHDEPLAGDLRPIELDELRETVFSFGGNVPEQEPVPYRHRIYVGAALAILMIALLVMAYRGRQDWARSSRPLPQAAPSASPEPAVEAAKPDRLAPDKSAPDRHPANTAAEARVGDDNRQEAQAESRVALNAEAAKNGAPAKASPKSQPTRNTAAVTPPPSPSSLAANQGNGSEELLVAERYLNATAGRGRDTSEAAKWLWQSVAKQNGVATLLLSDLYLKGDGVPKNCEQARLLLDAAARKGIPGAGERLRNLQAFGCQ